MPRRLHPFVVLLLMLIAALRAEESATVRQVRALLPPGITARVLTVVDDAGITVDAYDVVTSHEVPVEGQTFRAARRVVVATGVDPVYKVQARGPRLNGSVAKDDVLLISFWIRAPEAAGGATGNAMMRLQVDGPPWDGAADTVTGADATWKQVFARGVVTEGTAQGPLVVVWHLGYQRQTIDLAGLVVLDLGPGIDPATLPSTRITYPGRAADAPWRAEAAQRIDRYRKGDLTVTVRDAAGRPVPGAAVTLAQRRLAFGIGSFTGTKVLDQDADGAKNRAQFTRFNRVTTPIYWADWGWPSQREPFLAIGAWAHGEGFAMRAHPIIYPGWEFLPKALQALKDDPIALQAKMLEHVREICAATRELGYREYDVTNELRYLQDIHKLVGREGVAAWFAAARAALPPGTRLAINENTILTDGGATGVNQQIYLDWIRDLEKFGQKPDVVGFQGHFGESLTEPQRVWEILDRFAKTGCELQITEFDFNTLDQAVQADYTRDFLTAVFAHPAVTAFTMWGFWEGDIWQRNAALYRRDWTPKPNGLALEALLAAWRTDASGTTGADGTFKVRGFRGDYAITVTAGGAPWHGTATLGETTAIPVALP